MLELVVAVATLALILIFSVTVDGFATIGNLRVILSNSASLAVLSCGMAVVIISRGLDLSLIAQMVAGATTFGILINAGVSGRRWRCSSRLRRWSLVGFAERLADRLCRDPGHAGDARVGACDHWSACSASPSCAASSCCCCRNPIRRSRSSPATFVPGVSVPVVLMVADARRKLVPADATPTAGRIIYAMGDNFQAARLSGLPVRTTTDR